VLTFWFFATPIIYSWDSVPGLKLFLDFNPFTHLAVSYQEILFWPQDAFGHWKWLLALGGASIVVFLIGYWLFDRLRDSFAEVV
jgi:ABC-type polysaccharide/polyol phosphate export permease